MSISFISEHFSWSEAECHDGTDVPTTLQPNARRLAVNVLEKVRDRFGKALIPISWYRTREYNKKIGGAANSQHIWALAADVRPADITELPRLCAVVETMIVQGELPVLGGFGKYRGWIHLDARVRKSPTHIARWLGKGVGSEQ